MKREFAIRFEIRPSETEVCRRAEANLVLRIFLRAALAV
jgi:hypothetical protein